MLKTDCVITFSGNVTPSVTRSYMYCFSVYVVISRHPLPFGVMNGMLYFKVNWYTFSESNSFIFIFTLGVNS